MPVKKVSTQHNQPPKTKNTDGSLAQKNVEWRQLPYKVKNNGVCSIHMSAWVQADKKSGNIGAAPNFSNASQDVTFIDLNKNGRIDKDDAAKYKNAAGEESTVSVDQVRRGYFPTQLDISLSNGQRAITTIVNKEKADAVLNFENNQVSEHGSTTKLQDEIDNTSNTNDGQLYKMTEDYVSVVSNMLSDATNVGMEKLLPLTRYAKGIDDSNTSSPFGFTTKIPGSSLKLKSPSRQELLKTMSSQDVLSIYGVREFVEKPILNDIQKPITRDDMKEKNNWNSRINFIY